MPSQNQPNAWQRQPAATLPGTLLLSYADCRVMPSGINLLTPRRRKFFQLPLSKSA